MKLGRIHDPGQFGRTAQIAGIDADGLGAIFHGGNRQTMIKMDVRDQGNGDRRPNLSKGRRRLKIKDRHPDQLTTSLLKSMDLGHGSGDITGIGIGHGLHRNGTTAAHRHIANLYFPGLPPHNHDPLPSRLWFSFCLITSQPLSSTPHLRPEHTKALRWQVQDTDPVAASHLPAGQWHWRSDNAVSWGH